MQLEIFSDLVLRLSLSEKRKLKLITKVKSWSVKDLKAKIY